MSNEKRAVVEESVNLLNVDLAEARLKVSDYTDPNEFLLAQYGSYAKNVSEGDSMEFDDWLAGSDLPEIVKVREQLQAQDGKQSPKDRNIAEFELAMARAKQKGLEIRPSVNGPYVFNPSTGLVVGRKGSEEYRLAISENVLESSQYN